MTLKNFMLQLVSNSDGSISHTKFWSNIAYTVATGAFIWVTYKTPTPSTELWLIYLGTLAGHATASKYLNNNNNNKNKNNKEEK